LLNLIACNLGSLAAVGAAEEDRPLVVDEPAAAIG
jgi:hypothetical protein